MTGFMNIFKSYRLLMVFSSLILTLAVSLAVLSAINSVIESNIQKIRSEAAGYKTGEIRTRLNDLEKALSETNPPYLNRREAKILLLETLENFRTLYGGSITEELTDSGSAYTAEMEFEIEPTDPSQIIQIADYLENNVAPVIVVKKMTFTSGGKKKVMFAIRTTQPYFGGNDEQ
ncbi:hypothetical protein [Seleniivibrio woodruffii]|uniref:hypothetical protein n=1 Tax=Seleniivibrio woodruffii TaxID=1078050 RepID=UPI0039E249E1